MTVRFSVLAAAMAGIFSSAAWADSANFPNQPIKIIIPYQAPPASE